MSFATLPDNLREICEGKRADLTEHQQKQFESWCRQFASPQPSTVTTSMPSMLIRGWNFTAAIARWTLAGMPRRTQAEIDERLAICQTCPFLQNQHCTRCGCACVEQNQLINKLALATETCPEGKWK